MYLGSELTDDDTSCWHWLPAINLDATTLAHRVTPILSRTAPFLMGSLNCEGDCRLWDLQMRDAAAHRTSGHKRLGTPNARSEKTRCQHFFSKLCEKFDVLKNACGLVLVAWVVGVEGGRGRDGGEVFSIMMQYHTRPRQKKRFQDSCTCG